MMRVSWFGSALAFVLTISLLVNTTPASVPTLAAFADDAERVAVSRLRSSTVLSELRRGFVFGLDQYWALSNKLAKRTERDVSPPQAGVAAFISPAPLVVDAPTNLTVTATSSTSISLSWTAPADAVSNYEVQRGQNPSGLFSVVGSPTGTTFNDTTVSSGSAYLYRVRAVAGGIPSSPSNMAVGTAITFTDNPLSVGTTQIKAVHITELRQAINAVRSVAALSAATWTDTSLVGVVVKATHVQEMRDKLDEALSALNVPITAYTDPVLATGANGTPIKKVHIDELRQRASRGSSTNSGSISADTSTARLDPLNKTGTEGEDPLSRNFNWSVPLVNLPGRADLDLQIALTYNSLVWTKSGTSISFDDDRGFPSPGFRLGFPVIQPIFLNTETNKWAYMLITPSGGRVELRQVGSTALFESVDSSYMLLDTSTNPMVLRTTDGTQLSYAAQGSDFQCTQIKDRNGNFITISYTAFGRVDTVVDTLSRSVKFNYDGNQYLTSITQTWKVNGSNVTHNWATFTYSSPDLTIQTNFTGLTKIGPPNGSTLKVLKRVTLANNAYFDFDYTSWGQVSKVSSFGTDANLLNYRSYNLPPNSSTAWTDCPRFTERRDLAANWNRSGPNGFSNLPFGAEQEVVTSYTVPVSATWTPPNAAGQSGLRAQVTFADFTSVKTTQKIYYAGVAGETTGWQRGLPAFVETFDAAGALQKQVVSTWTQDVTNVPYALNPRVTETNTYDTASNRARTATTYQTVSLPDGTSCRLPQDVSEYQPNASTVLRRSRTEYNLTTTYTNRRIIGLVSDRYLYEVNPTTLVETLMSKQKFEYDETGSIVGNDAPVQHDNTNYTSSLVAGRGNLSSIKRYDVINTNLFVTTTSKYNTAGAVVESKDASDHVSTISYADAFAANGTTLDPALGFTTLAYPTTLTNGGSVSSFRYYYDFGAITWNQTPLPNNAASTPGPQQKVSYDSIGRIERVTNLFNNAYTRYVHGPNYVESIGTVNTVADESRSVQVFDGLGRLIAKVNNHPNSTGGFSAELIQYDVLGRSIKESNPTETSITISGVLQPYNWQAVGDDETGGWIYTQQTYDWTGRPRIRTASDGTTKEATYTGCGCAGGEVTTLSGETVLLPPQSGAGAFGNDRRKQKLYTDVLGRTVKTEMLNRDGSPYTTTVTEYNARDQVTAVKEYKGAATSDGSCPVGTCQLTSTGYDGHARVSSHHRPEQSAGTSTTWLYNNDDTVQKITDARGASETYTYNARHLVTNVTYAWPGGGTIPTPVTIGYDAAGNRTSMSDSTGAVSYHYDQLSRMDWEERNFTSLGSTLYRFSYGYNLAGNLTSLTEPAQFGASVTYGYDNAGRLNSVTGSGLPGAVTQLASNRKYRAWGDVREMDFGNGLRLNQGFNSNMLISNYQVKVPGTPVGEGERARSTYQYEADGRILQMSDFTDGNFGRSYFYDHVGRLIDADTASPAYFQSFSYDEFDHMTGRSNGSWRHSDFTVSNWQNNRNTSTTIIPPSHPACCPPQPVTWTYNADGEVTHDHNKDYTYDAAGNNIRVFETTDIGISLVNKLWIFQDYDSDGNRVKRVEQSQQNFGPFTFVTTYFLRSSVLDDAVLIELDQNGLKRRAFIFADGEALAQQENNQVHWVHIDPVTLSLRETEANGTLANRIEMDPMGNGTPLTDPEPPEVQTPDYIYPGTYEGTGNPYDGPSGCTLDGQPMPCSFVMGFVNIGAAAQCPDNRCGPRHNGRGWEFWDPDGGWQKRGPQSAPVLKKQKPTQTRPKSKPKPKPPKTEPPKKPGPKPDPEAESTQASPDGQLSPCLRNALRQFFPTMTAQGQTFSPVDDARFKNWIPSRFKAAAKLPKVVNPAAITLGLYDIHYDPQIRNISGGEFKSLDTVIEEVTHTTQFIDIWAGLQRNSIREFLGINSTGYGQAKRRWAGHYVHQAAKSGFDYDNAVEKWAKDRTAEIVRSLRETARKEDRFQLCGFKLY